MTNLMRRIRAMFSPVESGEKTAPPSRSLVPPTSPDGVAGSGASIWEQHLLHKALLHHLSYRMNSNPDAQLANDEIAQEVMLHAPKASPQKVLEIYRDVVVRAKENSGRYRSMVNGLGELRGDKHNITGGA